MTADQRAKAEIGDLFVNLAIAKQRIEDLEAQLAALTPKPPDEQESTPAA